MRYTDKWKDYELIDASHGERLERWGNVILIRPDPQAVFKTERKNPLWKKAHARYIRSNTGGGRWQIYKNVPDVWTICYGELKFNLKPMGFKHTGLFPEQAVNWDYMSDIIRSCDRQLKILNLFAYTGGATIACLNAGAAVTHVDASKGMVAWAKDNAVTAGLDKCPVRWLVDDCIKFVEREIRRGNKYDGIIMDPPSYGRGPNKEVWKLEDEIYDFVQKCTAIMSDNAEFMMINSYTAGISPSVMEYILSVSVKDKFGGCVQSDEIGLNVTETGMPLACGGTAIWRGKNS